jgi:hypothetical protein
MNSGELNVAKGMLTVVLQCVPRSIVGPIFELSSTVVGGRGC